MASQDCTETTPMYKTLRPPPIDIGKVNQDFEAVVNSVVVPCIPRKEPLGHINDSPTSVRNVQLEYMSSSHDAGAGKVPCGLNAAFNDWGEQL